MNWGEFFESLYIPKIITVDKIKELSKVQSQLDLKRVIDELKEGGYITPMGTKMTYQYPQVYEKYRVCKKDNSALLHEMNYTYHVSLNFDYYKSHIKEYEKDRTCIRQLSDYIMNGNLKSSEEMSVNERSFSIFGHEKYLASDDGRKLLGRLKLKLEMFHTYRTPEPFFYYYNPHIQSGNVLILENKDTWYTVRQLLREGRAILSVYFCAVIYGEGRKIQNSFKDIDFEEYKPFNDPGNTFYYFGDIDNAGIDILIKLKEEHKGYCILPFLEAYRFLLDYKDKKRTKTDKEDRLTVTKEKIEGIFTGMMPEEISDMYEICAGNYILPQEILNNDYLRNNKQ